MTDRQQRIKEAESLIEEMETGKFPRFETNQAMLSLLKRIVVELKKLEDAGHDDDGMFPCSECGHPGEAGHWGFCSRF